MEQNLPPIPTKIQNFVHAIMFMLKKTISKSKLDLNMMIKRGKIASKSLQNLLFHHHHNWSITTFHRHTNKLTFPTPPPGEYEFSCSNTPPYPLSLFSAKRKHNHRDISPPLDLNDDFIVNAEVMKALEMLTSATSSPAVWKNPMVKQLRITDSPFPLSNGDEDGEVDEAADKFIMRFYNDLSRQNKWGEECY